MSAYIVDKDVIDRIVWAICSPCPIHDTYGGIRRFNTVMDIPHETATYVPIESTHRDRLGRELWAANLSAVQQRYPTDTNGSRPGPTDFRDEMVEEYRYGRSDSTTSRLNRGTLVWGAECWSRTEAVLDDMGRLIYQMSEGDVPETAVYTGLQIVRGELAVQLLEEIHEKSQVAH
jgi:hypothetical protein